jgi:hypothetical protein
MLSSSSEYIKALREGKYLLFLGWSNFIAQTYNTDLNLLDADDTANILIFEWIINGFSVDDAKKLSILYSVYDSEPKPLQGQLDYSLKAITVALFLCMVFQKHHIEIPAPQTKLTLREINVLIKEKIALLEQGIYENSLQEIQAQFFHWVDSANKKEVALALEKINAITKPRYALEDYILYLEQFKTSDDVLYISRLSMAKRFLSYLYEQSELTAKVSEEIVKYVDALLELNPTKGEMVRLDLIAPPSKVVNTWRLVTGLGMSFFSTVFRDKSIGDLISGVSQKQDSSQHL